MDRLESHSGKNDMKKHIQTLIIHVSEAATVWL
jgi:hypothetical protein